MNTEKREMQRHYVTEDLLKEVDDWLFDGIDIEFPMEDVIGRKKLIKFFRKKAKNEYGVKFNETIEAKIRRLK